MAEKAKPVKKVRFNLTPNPSAGTSAGGGGGGGDGAAAPASATRVEPPSSPPRSPSPPQPFTYDFGEESTGGGGGGGGGAAVPASAPRREPPSSPPRSPSPPQPFTYDFSAESSGGGGGGAAAPASATRREAPSSPPRSPSPPQPFTYNFDEGSSGGGGGALLAGKSTYLHPPKNNRVAKDNYDDSVFVTPKPPELARQCQDSKDSDDKKPDEFNTEYGWGSLFMSDPEVLSSDPQSPPRYVGRQSCEPLSTQEFFSLRHNWQQLLDVKKTYLRGAAESNYADSTFVLPEPLDLALGCQEPTSLLVGVAARKQQPIRQRQFKILCEYYVFFRPIRKDGSQFYRAFLFSYLENLGKMQGSEAEVTRLMECVAKSKVNFRRLKWNNAYFSNPEAFFSSVVSEFEHLVNSVANGLNADELYKISLQEISSSRIISLLRLLTEVHIRTYEANFSSELIVNKNPKEKLSALSFCKEYVRPFGANVTLVQIKALSQALGIPLHIVLVEGITIGGAVQIKCHDFIPQSGPLSSTRRYYLSSATNKQSFLPPGNLLLSDRMPLVILLMVQSATDILYRK